MHKVSDIHRLLLILVGMTLLFLKARKKENEDLLYWSNLCVSRSSIFKCEAQLKKSTSLSLTDVTGAISCQAPAFWAMPSSAALATETTRLHVS